MQYAYKTYQAYLDHQADKALRTESRTLRRLDLIKYEAAILRKATSFRTLLCIGARHLAEVEAFREAGFFAEGIDLVANRGITVCDMSRMHESKLITDKRPFRVCYMSHSLEHCLNVAGLCKSLDFIWACVLYIVVPVATHATKWDCTIFPFMLPEGKPSTIETT